MMVMWCEDSYAAKTIAELMLTTIVELVLIADIDRKKSQNNAARLSAALDEDNVQSLVLGIVKGDEIPFLVLRTFFEKGRRRFCVAGGNHRLEAVCRLGQDHVKAYIVECGDSEFLALCQKLNLANGKGVSEKDRVQYAAHAFESRLYDTIQAAADFFRVSASKVKDFIKLQKAEQKLMARTGKRYFFPQKVVLALAQVQADEVFDAAISLAQNKKLDCNEKSSAIRKAIEQPTVSDQLAFIARVNASPCERKLATPDRKTFLSAVTSLETILAKHKTYESLDIVDDKSDIKARIDLISKGLRGL